MLLVSEEILLQCLWPIAASKRQNKRVLNFIDENIIDESVPEFANQYQYQYQYQKNYSVQYETSTSTAQVLSVPVPVPVQQTLTKFEREI